MTTHHAPPLSARPRRPLHAALRAPRPARGLVGAALARRRVAPALTALALALPAWTATGCGASDAGGSGFGIAPENSGWYGPGAASDAAASADVYGSGGWADAGPPPPEQDQDFDLRTPEAGDSELYIPSAALDALVVVDGDKLSVSLVEVGARPVLVRALPGDAGAVVLNAGTSDLSIVRPDASAQGGYRVITLDVPPNENQLVLSPDGTWAFAWYQAPNETAGGTSASAPVGALQDVTAVRLAHGDEAVFNLAVGLRPSGVRFAADGALAVFLCDDGLSIADLTTLDGDAFLLPIPVHDDPFALPNDREVSITPDGALAVVRDLDRKELTLVDVTTNTRRVLTLPDWPSDLDMTPDAARVVVPFRSTQELAILDIPGAFDSQPAEDAPDGLTDNPGARVVFTGHPFGATELSDDGARAILYTTLPGTLALGYLDVDAGTVGVRPLPKEVKSVQLAPGGSAAILIHRRDSGLHLPESQSDGYTVLDIDSGYAKLVLTAHEAQTPVFSADGEAVFLPIPDPANVDSQVHRVSTTQYAVTSYAMPAKPVYIGLLPSAGRAAVMLDDPTGWITLIDTASGALDQVNSFELNSFIQ